MDQIDDLFSKEEINEADLASLITNRAEESLYLEFKAAGALQSSDGKKNEIAKDVSAFANSDGGILIYGINEADHQAESFSYVDGNAYTKEWLENIIQSRINRRLPDFMVYPVRFDNDFSKTVYVVKIGRSYHAPHMTSDKKYYRRLNFQAVQMEEYEIRDAYSRTNKTDLIVDELIIRSAGNATQAQHLSEARFTIAFQIRNNGATIENQYKLEIMIPLVILKVNNPLSQYKIRNDNGWDVYSIPNTSPLFQEELTTHAEFNVLFNAHNKQYLDTPIKTKLYFSGGIHKKEFVLKGRLLYQERPIEQQF